MALRAIGEDGFSFPSGHATGSMLMGLLGAWMIIHWVLTRLGPRLVVWAAAGVLVAAVGASRLYLGVHYPSDVLAGWLLGAGWAVTVAVAVSLWEDHAAAPTAATTAPDRPWPRIALRSPVPDRGVSAVPADQPLPASCRAEESGSGCNSA